ncbi:hypothetical protein P171DRAFT_122463 [Karstenula rhodostoma CBS 690.94]|uniref:Uncharacterized protein n=1 Tax=Karstenula rhodostoma CBS 690.94 TaxID=1392251 RepID=A0A9P4P8I6_9PLEO|nr:hypothetical protein P171DRAFT_122463 [Karstenula rhodostoma CBS 690.94]
MLMVWNSDALAAKPEETASALANPDFEVSSLFPHHEANRVRYQQLHKILDDVLRRRSRSVTRSVSVSPIRTPSPTTDRSFKRARLSNPFNRAQTNTPTRSRGANPFVTDSEKYTTITLTPSTPIPGHFPVGLDHSDRRGVLNSAGVESSGGFGHMRSGVRTTMEPEPHTPTRPLESASTQTSSSHSSRSAQELQPDTDAWWIRYNAYAESPPNCAITFTTRFLKTAIAAWIVVPDPSEAKHSSFDALDQRSVLSPHPRRHDFVFRVYTASS